jgi:peptidoglycan/LPS O-acetylase OafA/YrhL
VHVAKPGDAARRSEQSSETGFLSPATEPTIAQTVVKYGPDDRRGGLDSLRFLAILAVLFDHYVDPEVVRPGNISVRFFLLISGFLITRTLLRHGLPDWSAYRVVLRSFYARRALRIWPLYHLLLVAIFAVGWISWRQLAVHGVFLTNFAQAWRNDWNIPWYLAHLWTLCVQEQYYLVWPLLFFFLGAKRWYFLVAMIAVAVCFRVSMLVSGQENAVGYHTLPMASFDALAMGSLLAIFPERWSVQHPLRLFAVLVTLCIAVSYADSGALRHAVLPVLWLFALGILTIGVFENRLGRASGILNWKPLVFLGRISLGIYLLHLPVWQAFIMWSPSGLHPYVSQPSIHAFGLLTLATILFSTLSWLFFERPLQQFRRYFPYRLDPAFRTS